MKCPKLQIYHQHSLTPSLNKKTLHFTVWNYYKVTHNPRFRFEIRTNDDNPMQFYKVILFTNVFEDAALVEKYLARFSHSHQGYLLGYWRVSWRWLSHGAGRSTLHCGSHCGTGFLVAQQLNMSSCIFFCVCVCLSHPPCFVPSSPHTNSQVHTQTRPN